MKQYEAVVSKTIPALAPDPENVESDPSWSQEQAEAALFQRLALEEELGTDRGGADRDSASKCHWQSPSFGQSGDLAQCVDAMCCRRSAVHCSRRIRLSGRHTQGREDCCGHAARKPDHTPALEQQVSDAGHEREVLRAEMAQRDHMIADLRHQIEQQSPKWAA